MSKQLKEIATKFQFKNAVIIIIKIIGGIHLLRILIEVFNVIFYKDKKSFLFFLQITFKAFQKFS